MFDQVLKPWPWYVAGPIIGLMVPLLLVLGNKFFGISSSLRHVCAACLPSKIPYFDYDWRMEKWNLYFVGGVIIGAFLAVRFLSDGAPMVINEKLAADLSEVGVIPSTTQWPEAIFSFSSLFTLRGFIMMIVGGFMVGFGTRYAGGCTSGHSIMGLSSLQWPSLVATICFMIGGFLMTHLFLPFILKF